MTVIIYLLLLVINIIKHPYTVDFFRSKMVRVEESLQGEELGLSERNIETE